MRTAFIVSLCVVLLGMLAWAATQEIAKFEVPVLPTERDEFGGRPGTFHFVTNEQKMADAAELKKAMEALGRIETAAQSMSKTERERFATDVAMVKQFATNVHLRRHGSAGTTAKEIEERLNASKGKFMCGACHGHGMMRGMHRMPAGGKN